MKKVLFVCSLYHPHVGGIETMIKGLSDFYRIRGVETAVLTKRWPLELSEHDTLNGQSILRVRSSKTPQEHYDVIQTLLENEDEIKADAIHVIGIRRPLPMFALLLAVRWNVPLQLTVAGGEIPDTVEEHHPEWEDNKEDLIPVIMQADAVSSVSEGSRKSMQLLVPERNEIITCYAGIDSKLIAHVAPARQEEKYILSLRRLVPSKGIDFLIRAFAELVKDYPDLALVVAGDGPEREKLESLAKDLNIASQVRFLGTVTFQEGIALLKSAFCTVVPSLSEGGGLVNIEAQASGCPVVATNVGGIPEYVEDGTSGLLCKPADARDLEAKLRMLLDDSAFRSRLIEGGYAHAARFSWDVLGPQYLALYGELAKVSMKRVLKPWSELVADLNGRLT